MPDLNLCDACMEALGADKLKAWMGHTDEGGGVVCERCEQPNARLCFEVPHDGTRRQPWVQEHRMYGVILENGTLEELKVNVLALNFVKRQGFTVDGRAHDTLTLMVPPRVIRVITAKKGSMPTAVNHYYF